MAQSDTKMHRFSADFKLWVAKDALRELDSVQSIAARHGGHPNQVREWRRQAEAGMAEGFRNAAYRGPKKVPEKDLVLMRCMDELHTAHLWRLPDGCCVVRRRRPGVAQLCVLPHATDRNRTQLNGYAINNQASKN